MDAIVLENPLLALVAKGMTVLPEKSYASKKLYTGIGISYHQLGNPKIVLWKSPPFESDRNKLPSVKASGMTNKRKSFFSYVDPFRCAKALR